MGRFRSAIVCETYLSLNELERKNEKTVTTKFNIDSGIQLILQKEQSELKISVRKVPQLTLVAFSKESHVRKDFVPLCRKQERKMESPTVDTSRAFLWGPFVTATIKLLERK